MSTVQQQLGVCGMSAMDQYVLSELMVHSCEDTLDFVILPQGVNLPGA